MIFYYTYVLKSKIDGQLYIGWTNNLKKRLTKHNRGQVKATKPRKPFELVYFEGCLNKLLCSKATEYSEYRKVCSLASFHPCSRATGYSRSLNKRNAILREKQLKTGFGRKYLKLRMGY